MKYIKDSFDLNSNEGNLAYWQYVNYVMYELEDMGYDAPLLKDVVEVMTQRKKESVLEKFDSSFKKERL